MSAVPIHSGIFTLPGDPRGPRLLAARCAACARHHFPASDTCPYCGGEECAEAALGATGTLSLFTAVRSAPPGYPGPVPYGLGVVDLPEGMRVVARLDEDRIERLRRGLAMELRIAPLFTNEAGEEVLSYSYAPASAGDPPEDGTTTRGDGSGGGA